MNEITLWTLGMSTVQSGICFVFGVNKETPLFGVEQETARLIVESVNHKLKNDQQVKLLQDELK